MQSNLSQRNSVQSKNGGSVFKNSRQNCQSDSGALLTLNQFDEFKTQMEMMVQDQIKVAFKHMIQLMTKRIQTLVDDSVDLSFTAKMDSIESLIS